MMLKDNKIVSSHRIQGRTITTFSMSPILKNCLAYKMTESNKVASK